MIRKRTNKKKRLHKGKKLEAKKALFTASEHGALTGSGPGSGGPYLEFPLTTTFVSVK
ncbi:MAG: hypothetical protein WCC21_14410 [Candidatus Acidiferrales bacterium]